MFDGAIVVDGRSASRHVRELGIRCDDKEIPEPVDDIKPQGWWIAADCTFTGTAWAQDRAGRRSGTMTTKAHGTAALVVAGGRLAVIVSPAATTEPAIWIATAASTLNHEHHGSHGLSGPPGQIDLAGEGWRLELGEVSRLFRHTKTYQTGQERPLLEALAAAARQPAFSPAAAKAAEQAASAGPADEPERSWLPDDRLGGLYRLYLDGAPASATALVDRELPRGEQMRALACLDWPPPRQLSAVFRATEHGSMPKPFLAGLADGRLVQPFYVDHGTVIDAAEPPSNHPVYRYLWPAVSADGELVLDEGEEISLSWSSPPPDQATVLSDGRRAGASTHIPSDLRNVRGYLTNRRLAVVGQIAPPPLAAQEDYSLKLALVSPALDDLRAALRQVRRWHDRQNLLWAAHFRHEWIDEIGIRTRTVSGKKAGLFTKARTDEVSTAFYARLHVPHGAINELSFPLSGPEAAADLADRCSGLLLAISRRMDTNATRTREGKALNSARSVVTDAYRTVHGAVPHSLPPTL